MTNIYASWGQEGVALHPKVVSYRNNCDKLCHQRYVTVPITQLLIKYSSTSLIRPPFIRISLLSGRDLAVIFFLCVQ